MKMCGKLLKIEAAKLLGWAFAIKLAKVHEERLGFVKAICIGCCKSRNGALDRDELRRVVEEGGQSA